MDFKRQTSARGERQNMLRFDLENLRIQPGNFEEMMHHTKIGTSLFRIQFLKSERRNIFQIGPRSGVCKALSGNDNIVTVNQNRRSEAHDTESFHDFRNIFFIEFAHRLKITDQLSRIYPKQLVAQCRRYLSNKLSADFMRRL